MNPKEIIERETWWLLKEIKKELLLQGHRDEGYILFSYRKQGNNNDVIGYTPSEDTQYNLLDRLENLGILKHESHLYQDFDLNKPWVSSGLKVAEGCRELYVNETEFNNIYIKHEKAGESVCDVIFEDNGNLMYLKKKIVNVKRITHYYFFLKILHENFGNPISHKAIFDYCNKMNPKVKPSKNETEQEFCNDKKSMIAKKAEKLSMGEFFNKIVIEATIDDSLNGYMMCNPE